MYTDDYPKWMKPVENGQEFHPSYETENPLFSIHTNEWTHIICARFGEGRLCGRGETTKWTGNSYRYDIFEKGQGRNKQYALRWENGSGAGWYVSDDQSRRNEANLLATFAAIKVETLRWDACHFIWEIAARIDMSATRREYKRVSTAFVEGRLKKRKQRGQDRYTVHIERKIPAEKS